MIFKLLRSIFNATPPAEKQGANFQAPPQPVVSAIPDAVASTEVNLPNTTVQAYLNRLAAEPVLTGVGKYLLKLERDAFNLAHQPAKLSGVERYLSEQRQVVRPSHPQGAPTGVEKYLTALEAAA